ncbi:Lachesin [Araneus ventricosus]|uniref:Lachesin n=1 Tax=Araneus ventricosus TaxID=182803 RepID=A0A4Y2DZA7_ARAVE|nr:Lachesin [Araneus ventricosus]
MDSTVPFPLFSSLRVVRDTNGRPFISYLSLKGPFNGRASNCILPLSEQQPAVIRLTSIEVAWPVTVGLGVRVLIPPTIIESSTSSDTVIEERSKVSLRCEASGYPEPIITWRREDGKDINLGSYGGRKYSALRVEGEYLNISQVSREDMGAYLCIAANGVLPSVSKRIILQVNFRPKIRVPNQLVGAASGSDVTLECRLEASPSPLTSWIRSDGIMLLNNRKYEIAEEKNGYKINMKIKIYKLTENDFGSYKCVAKNTLGEKEGFIRLYEIPPPTANPKVTQHYEVYLPRLRDKTLRPSSSESGAEDETMPSRPLQGTPNSEQHLLLSTSKEKNVHFFIQLRRYTNVWLSNEYNKETPTPILGIRVCLKDGPPEQTIPALWSNTKWPPLRAAHQTTPSIQGYDQGGARRATSPLQCPIEKRDSVYLSTGSHHHITGAPLSVKFNNKLLFSQVASGRTYGLPPIKTRLLSIKAIRPYILELHALADAAYPKGLRPKGPAGRGDPQARRRNSAPRPQRTDLL